MHDLVKTQENLLTVLEDHPVSELIEPLQKRILLFDSFVAGTTHVPDQSVFHEMEPGDTLRMQREDNEKDKWAILLLDSKGRKAGYIPARDNLVFARLMDAGKLLEAEVKGLEHPARFWKIPISIYLIDF